MCGRLDQHHQPSWYAAALGWPVDADRSEAIPHSNVTPGTYRPLLHEVDGKHVIDDLFWGYRAHFAAGKLPIAINARLEKLDNRYWKRLLENGRAIVAADGWYEWTGDKGQRQPWHVHLKTRAPVFMAAIANFGEFREHRAEAGFVIVTEDARGGMLDVHDRRPLLLAADDARAWLSARLTTPQALALARSRAQEAGLFAWHHGEHDLGRTLEAAPKQKRRARQHAEPVRH